MTPAQALRKARKLWGKNAMVKKDPQPTIINGHQVCGRFKIGRVMLGLFFSVESYGDSWEDAFRKYDAKIEAEKARYAKH